MTKPRLLDLFCGAGGAAMGYHRAGFEVVGVDIEPIRNYPFTFVRADVLEYVEPWHMGFDAIHASPPCQAYSRAKSVHRKPHADLMAPTRALLEATGLPYVIENVVLAPMRADLILCGTMFGLKVRRHRMFEANWPLSPFGPLDCSCAGQASRGELLNPHNTIQRNRFYAKQGRRGAYMLGEAMGIDWVKDSGGHNRRGTVSEAIPPAYTEWIGKQLMEAIKVAA